MSCASQCPAMQYHVVGDLEEAGGGVVELVHSRDIEGNVLTWIGTLAGGGGGGGRGGGREGEGGEGRGGKLGGRGVNCNTLGIKSPLQVRVMGLSTQSVVQHGVACWTDRLNIPQPHKEKHTATGYANSQPGCTHQKQTTFLLAGLINEACGVIALQIHFLLH